MPAVTAFLSIDNQWSSTPLANGAVVVNGLNYGGVRAGLDMAGIALTPDLWADIQMIEVGAVAEMNRGRMQ